MSKKLSATGLIALAFCLCSAFAWKSRAGQDQRTINIKIEDFPQAYQNKEPVKIIGLYLGTDPIKSGEDFQADKDWLRDLRVMVTNWCFRIVGLISDILQTSRTRNSGC